MSKADDWSHPEEFLEQKGAGGGWVSLTAVSHLQVGPCKGQKRKIERIPEAQTVAGLADLGGLFPFVVTFRWEVLVDYSYRKMYFLRV